MGIKGKKYLKVKVINHFRGYNTSEGWKGELYDGTFALFATEEEWREYLELNKPNED